MQLWCSFVSTEVKKCGNIQTHIYDGGVGRLDNDIQAY